VRAAAASALRRFGPEPAPAPPRAEPPRAGLVRRGDTWSVTWAGVTTDIRHAKGIADLALLMERSGREVHVRELDGQGAPARSGTAAVALDPAAVDQYRRRIAQVELELAESERNADIGRAAQLGAERDAIVGELTTAFGLGGRARRLGSDPDERLRKAVSARVKASIDRLEQLHPALGRHLRTAVRTGYWCCYDPELPVAWRVER
jgi:hypothetical protein